MEHAEFIEHMLKRSDELIARLDKDFQRRNEHIDQEFRLLGAEMRKGFAEIREDVAYVTEWMNKRKGAIRFICFFVTMSAGIAAAGAAVWSALGGKH